MCWSPSPSSALAAELLSLTPDLLYCVAAPGAHACQKATSTSLARPGANITGIGSLRAELTAKRIELFKELVPALRRVLVTYDAREAEERAAIASGRPAAERLGVTLIERSVTSKKIPTMYPAAFWSNFGALASYGADQYLQGRQDGVAWRLSLARGETEPERVGGMDPGDQRSGRPGRCLHVLSTAGSRPWIGAERHRSRLLVLGLANTIARLPAGWIIDRSGTREPYAVGNILLAAGATIVFPHTEHLGLLLTLAAVFGAVSGVAFVAVSAALTAAAPPMARGLVMGGYSTALYLGLALGSFAVGPIINREGHVIGFAVGGALGALGVLLSAVVRGPRPIPGPRR